MAAGPHHFYDPPNASTQDPHCKAGTSSQTVSPEKQLKELRELKVFSLENGPGTWKQGPAPCVAGVA